MRQSIDFNNPIPFYIQLMDAIRENIIQGVWQPGDQLPGEHSLCETYGVSRTVVRQALRELELERLIYRRKGKGSFVSEPKLSGGLAQKLTGFYQDMVERGHRPVSQILIQEVIPATANVAYHLEIEAGTPVVELQRLRFVEAEPIVLVTSYLPHDRCPGLEKVDFREQSLYVYLETAYQLVIAQGRRFIEAVAADENEAKLLQVEPGAPLIFLDSVSYLEDGTPIEHYHAFHRGDRSRFEVALFRLREQDQLHKAVEANKQELPRSNDLVE